MKVAEEEEEEDNYSVLL